MFNTGGEVLSEPSFDGGRTLDTQPRAQQRNGNTMLLELLVGF